MILITVALNARLAVFLSAAEVLGLDDTRSSRPTLHSSGSSMVASMAAVHPTFSRGVPPAVPEGGVDSLAGGVEEFPDLPLHSAGLWRTHLGLCESELPSHQ